MNHGTDLDCFKLPRCAYIGDDDMDAVFRADLRADMKCPGERYGKLQVGNYVTWMFVFRYKFIDMLLCYVTFLFYLSIYPFLWCLFVLFN